MVKKSITKFYLQIFDVQGLAIYILFVPFLDWSSGGHSPLILSGGRTTYLYLYSVPVESGPIHSPQSLTIHGSGTVRIKKTHCNNSGSSHTI
jgi:hypothetical protein